MSEHTCGRISLWKVQTRLADGLARQFLAVPLGPASRDDLSELFRAVWCSCEWLVFRGVVGPVRVGLLYKDSLFFSREPTERVVIACKLVRLFVRLDEIRSVE